MPTVPIREEVVLPSANATVVRHQTFAHKGANFDVVAFVEPTDPFTFKVDVTSGKNPVVVTYPDGYQATLCYSVTMSTQLNMSAAKGIDAISYLMRTAENDIKALV